MTKTNDFSVTLQKVGMRFANAEKLVNYLIAKNIHMNGNVLLAMLGSKQMYEILIKKCDPNAKIIIGDSKLVTVYFRNRKNITCININENDANDFYNKLKNMPKFDYVIQNPPYSGSLHLDFFKKGNDILNDTGKMVIIEPATWLINLNKNSEYTTGKRGNLTPTIKKEINKHVKRVVIENYNKEFNTANTVPFSITHIDKSKNYDKIDFTCFGINTQVDTIYDCNLIGNSKLINSIFDKIKNCDTAKNHVINEQLNNDKIYYCQISQIIWTIAGLYYQRPQFALSNTAYYKLDSGEYYQSCLAGVIHISRNDITNIIPKKAARGGSSKGKVKLTNNPAKCIYGSQEELINWKHFVFKNSLPLFINMAIIIDQNNSVLQFIPWLVDKQRTDKEIYDMFSFTDEEINLIETTIKKFERNSPWFKRYMCGPSFVSDEEVQKFINNLNNA